MTQRDPIEAALRGAAPDEPSSLPPLEIERATVRPVRGVLGRGPVGRRMPAPWPLVALGAIVAAAITWQLAGAGRSTSPQAPSGGPSPTSSVGSATGIAPSPAAAGPHATFNGEGIAFEYPSGWHLHHVNEMSTMGSTIAIVGTADLSACGGDIVGINCAYATPLGPGDILVFVGTAASPTGSILDMAPPGGFTEFIDGMPAVMHSTGPIPQTSSDDNRSWAIGRPGSVNNWYVVEGTIRGPGLPALRDQIDGLARSIRFDHPAASLPTDSAAIDRLVASAVNALDRDARESYHSTYYACFPRRVGSSEPTVITDGPGGPLVGPIRVTCSISMEAEAVGLFAMTLAASWEAGPGYAAGTYREVLQIAGDATLGGMRSFNETFFPETRPEVTPMPATTPIALAPGSLVEVLFPGVSFYMTPDRNGDMLSDLPYGQRLWIVNGPRRVAGEDWYRVQWTPTPTYGGIPGWMPATEAGHPVVAPVAPRCPPFVGDVIDLVNLHPAERLACFDNRPMTLGPVTLRGEPNKTFPSKGTPAWLAETATIAMFGSQGPEGVDGPLRVRSDPSVGSLPVGSWLEITGHFDDPAARGCTRSWVGSADSAPSPESAAEQVLACREQFVITAVKAVPTP
jgi:hypothetical protein